MKPQYTKSNTASTVLVAVLQIMASIIAAIGFFCLSLYRLVTVFTSHGSLLLAFFSLIAGVVLVALLLMSAIRTLSLLSTSKTISRSLKNRSGRIPLSDIVKITRRAEQKLSDDLQIMISRKFFKIPLQFDLYRKEVVLGENEEIHPPEPDPSSDMMQKIVVKRSALPIYLFIFTWLLYIILFPINTLADLIVPLVISLTVLILSVKFSPPIRRVVDIRRPKVKQEPVKTGKPDVDDALSVAYKQLAELQRLDRSITDEKIDTTIQKLVMVAQDILTFVSEHPEKMRQIRQFLSYYLPTTVKLLDTYEEFERQQIKGENILESMTKIEGMVQDILKAFQKELDNLYFDKAIDISTDIDVMQAMLRQEGIGSSAN